MLRKHNKFIMLLVLVTFMFTMVASASATSFSDVTGTSAQASAISRLTGLGVLEGYPDGTFGPEKTITRAEFAKIACVTAGLKSVASGMGGTASTFSDVATNHWANGWINVAAAQGFVKGYPDGTFKPEGNITQAEAITVLMRLLGYNDNLAGNWPSDYIAKAANLGVLDDITFVADQAATRGVVAVLTSASLDQNVVEYAASDNLFNEAQKTYSLNGAAAKAQSYTLLYDKFDKSAKYEDALAIQFRYDSDGNTYLEYYQYNDDQTAVLSQTTPAVAGAVAANLIEKKLAKDCVFSGGGTILTTIENFVKFDVDKDGNISNIVVEDYAPVGPKLTATSILNEVKVDSGKAKIDDKDYSFLDPAQVVEESILPTEFAQNTAKTAFVDGTYNDGDAYRLILNKDGKVAGLRSYTFPTPGIVDKVVGDRVYYKSNAAPLTVAAAFSSNSKDATWNGFCNVGNFADKNIYVQRDGQPAKLADIQPLDTVSVLDGYRGTDYYVIATSLKISGQLTSATYDTTGTYVQKVKVMGLTWNVPYTNFNFLGGLTTSYTPRFSIDSGDTIEGDMSAATLDSEYDLWNQNVQVLTSVTGKAAALIFGEASSASKMYGVITNISTDMAGTDGTTVRNIKVMKSDGTEYSYPISEDTYIKTATLASTKIKDSALTLDTVDDTIMTKDAGKTTITANTEDEKLVGISLKSSGLVDRIEVINQTDQPYKVANVDTDNKMVLLGKTWVDATDVVVYNLNNNSTLAPAAANSTTQLSKTKVGGWTELKNSIVAPYAAWYIDSNNKLQYIVINGAALTTGDKYAIYQESYSDSDDWVTFVGQDPVKRDKLPANVTKGDVVHYTMSGSDAVVDVRTVPYGTTSAVTVSKTSGLTLLLDNGQSYKTDSDTVYLDAQKDTALAVVDGVNQGDAVLVMADATGLAKAVAIVKYGALTASAITKVQAIAGTYAVGDTITITLSKAIDASKLPVAALVALDPTGAVPESLGAATMTPAAGFVTSFKITLGVGTSVVTGSKLVIPAAAAPALVQTAMYGNGEVINSNIVFTLP